MMLNQQMDEQIKYHGDFSHNIFLSYVSKNISALEQKVTKINKIKKHSSSLGKIEQQIEFFSKMRQHFYISIKQHINNGAAPDPELSSMIMSISPKSYYNLATILVFSSLTNYQTYLKHQMISQGQTMYEQFQKAKTLLFNPLDGLDYNEQITLEQTIRQTELSLNNVLGNHYLNQYLQQLQIIKNKPLRVCKEQVVIQQNQEEQIQQQKQQILKINNSSSQSQKPKKTQIPNYQGDEQVFTGDSDHTFNQKKFIKKYAKIKKTNKKYVEQQNYDDSHEEQKHKKNRHLVWRHHHIQQGFDTDKQKK